MSVHPLGFVCSNISFHCQVPPIAHLITQSDVPMYLVTRCLDILSALAENGESVLLELCKISALPLSLGRFIERICDDPATQHAVCLPKILVEDSIKLLCSIVIKACSSGRLKLSGSSDPGYLHAQSLRSTCMRLLSRFKPLPLPLEAAAHSPISQSSIAVTMPGNFSLLAFCNLLAYQLIFVSFAV